MGHVPGDVHFAVLLDSNVALLHSAIKPPPAVTCD
jgi:hypothetical protein